MNNNFNRNLFLNLLQNSLENILDNRENLFFQNFINSTFETDNKKIKKNNK